jgi:hypothetical protein
VLRAAAGGAAETVSALVSIVAANWFNCDAAPGPISRRDVHNGVEEAVGSEPVVAAFSGADDRATLTGGTGDVHGAADETEAEVVAAGAAGFGVVATHSPPAGGTTLATGASEAVIGAMT